MLNLHIPKPPCEVRDLRAGNIDALSCYAYRYLKVLGRYARFYTRHQPTADELAERALAKLWECRQQMETPRCVHNFLHRQIYQEVCNWIHESITIRE